MKKQKKSMSKQDRKTLENILKTAIPLDNCGEFIYPRYGITSALNSFVIYNENNKFDVSLFTEKNIKSSKHYKEMVKKLPGLMVLWSKSVFENRKKLQKQKLDKSIFLDDLGGKLTKSELEEFKKIFNIRE